MCLLHDRFFSNQVQYSQCPCSGVLTPVLQTRSVVLALLVNQTGFIGNEEAFFVALSIAVDLSSNNTDSQPAHNRVRIPFALDSEADINVAV